MSGKAQASAYVNELLVLMHAHGFHGARKPGEPKGLDPATKPHRGSVIGLPVTTSVRSSSQKLDLSGALREAEREAADEQHDVFVTIGPARGRPIEASYVSLRLDVWLDVMARLFPDAVTSQVPLVRGGV